MVEQDFCSNCPQSRNCRSVYERLSGMTGPSVALRAVLAFLLPLIVFIIALAVSKSILVGIIKNQGLQTLLSLVSAGGAGFICILVAKSIMRRLDKDKNQNTSKGHR